METQEKILQELKNKVVDVINHRIDRKKNKVVDYKYSYWDTYSSIDFGTKYDYYNIPTTYYDNGCTGLYHIAVKFEKLSNEAIEFLVKNYIYFKAEVIENKFTYTQKGFWYNCNNIVEIFEDGSYFEQNYIEACYPEN